MTELILGTAEFNKDGYAGKPPLEKREIIRILNTAWEGGIRTLDDADTYNTEWIRDFYSGFFRLNKSRWDSCYEPAYNDFYHYKADEEVKPYVLQASVYTKSQVKNLTDAIVPLNINNLTFSHDVFSDTERFIARSIFDRGRLLDEGYTVHDCLSFVYRHAPKGVIVGVSSVKELQEILTAWGSLNEKK